MDLLKYVIIPLRFVLNLYNEFMHKLTNQLMALTAVLQIVLGWSGWLILKSLYPEMSLFWYAYMPLLFALLGIVSIILFGKNYKMKATKLVNLYLLMKLVKFFVVGVFFLGFYFIVKENIRVFASVFAIYYAFYILLETFIFYSIEKQIKKESK